MLITYGCDLAQGHHFSRPIPAEEVAPWLSSSPFGLAPGVADTAGSPAAASQFATFAA